MKKSISKQKKLASQVNPTNSANTTMGTLSIEHLHHFRCGSCNKWWSIGDPSVADSADPAKSSASKREWFCSWCGKKNNFFVKI